MKTSLAILLAVAFSFAALGETPETGSHKATFENGETNGLGAGGTVFNTWGFLYRRHFANGLGFSTSLGGWLNRDGGYVGSELGLLYTVAHHKFSKSPLPNSSIRVYLVGYLANIISHGHDYSAPITSTAVKTTLSTGLGAGPGVEFFFNNHFGCHLELPWMTFLAISNKTVTFDHSYPNIGGGVVYYF